MASKIKLGSYMFLILCMLCWANVALASTESPAKFTTLPPASPTGNTSDPCNFTDRYSLIDRVDADWRGYNLSLLVATCEGVCPLVYGTGNPDISGIGAMISYGIQAVVVLLFGPLLALLYTIYNFDLSAQLPEPRDRRSRLFSFAGELSQSVQTGNILTSFSVLIASIIRTQQLAPIAELNFITFLALYQFAMAFAASLSYSAVFGADSTRFTFLGFHTIAALCLCTAIVFLTVYPSSKVILLDKITTYCVFDWDYPIPIIYVENDDVKHEGDEFVSTLYGPSIIIVIIMAFVYIFSGAWLNRICDICRNKFIALCEHFHVNPKKLLFVFSIFTLTALWVNYSILGLFQLQLQRRQLQLVSGNAYQDSEWGFGQITAILLWWPMFSDIILGILEFVRPEHLSSQREVAHDMQPLHANTSPVLPTHQQPTHSRDLNAQMTSSCSVSRDGIDNNVHRMSQETLISGEQNETHMDNTIDRSAPPGNSDPVAVPEPPSLSSPAEASPSCADSRPTLDQRQSDSGEATIHQRPTWPHNDSGTYLPVRSLQ